MQVKRYIAPALLGAALLGACADDPTSVPVVRPAPMTPVGMVEITLSGVGTAQMNAVATPIVISPTGARANLTPVPGGTPAGSIQLRRVSATTVDVGTRGAGGRRYIQAVFEVRNADAAGNAYGTARQNLTFLPVEVASTLSGTPVRSFLKQDGTAADPSMAIQLMPTGAVSLGGTGDLVSQYPDVLQAYTETETASLSMPSGVTNTLPYGFVVRNAGDNTTRTLPANPADGQFDGRVTFAYSIPLAATSADDPFTISIVAVAMDDGETRITQSMEEQGDGQAMFEARAASLGATSVTLLAGGAYSGGAFTRTICSVRTAGPANAPGAVLTSAAPCAESGQMVTWMGTISDDWALPGNWNVNRVPTLNDTVAIGARANQPVLDQDRTIRYLMMTDSAAGWLDLNTHMLTVTTNVDAPQGSVTNGMVMLNGSNPVLNGEVGALYISGGATLGGATRATGSVSITGSLNTAGKAFTIAIP